MKVDSFYALLYTLDINLFSKQYLQEVASIMINDLKTMTPAAVDNVFVQVMKSIQCLAIVIDRHERFLGINETKLADYKKTLALVPENGDSSYWDNLIKAQNVKIKTEKANLAKAQNETIPLTTQYNQCQDEFNRRGGWTRFWIVTNATGHIHSSMSCSTCFPTTQYAWLPDLSGMNDGQVVELAGKMACTNCFPDAPVETRNRPSQIEEPERKAAREAREAKAAEKAAKTALKAITNPDGSEIKLAGKWGERITTEYSAQQTFSRNLVHLILHETGQRTIGNLEYVEEMRVDNAVLLVALAHKRGTTEAEQLALSTKKAQTTIKKDWK